MRAKFKIDSVKHFSGPRVEVEATPVCRDPGTPENESFHKWTPTGKLTMNICNPAAVNFLEPGKEYYVDFTPATSGESGSVTLDFLAALLLTLALIVSACAPQPGITLADQHEVQAAQLVEQLPGVVDSLAQIAMAAPVDDKTKQQISGYASWAKLAAATGSELGKVKSPDQLAGALTGLATLSQQLPVDPGTASQINNYVAWGSLIAKAAGIILPMVL